MSKHKPLYTAKLKAAPKKALVWLKNFWRGPWWHKLISCLVIFIALAFGGMYGIARWYQQTHKNEPLQLGVSFIADYANYLGVDPHQTFDALLNDLRVRQFRLVSYWKDIEPKEGQYNFKELDWEMQEAASHHATVNLSLGLRQPRWPECHAPAWIDTSKPESTWEPQLNAFVTTVVNRYKNSPALKTYQLENEFFNKFGSCNNFDRARLSRELALVKKLDPRHPVIISRSNNYVGFSVRQPLPDIIGISVYRRVWNMAVYHGYFTYPYPSWYYAFLAGGEELLTGKPAVIHELQTEPWPPSGQSILTASLAEQNKTFDAKRFKSTVQFAEQTGIRHIDLWGGEYWYYRMVKLHDPSVWNTAKEIFAQP